MKMAITPEPLMRDNSIIDFRAPPPSPVGSSRRSSVTNDEVLTEFLENSLKVPDLILPDRVFPRQKSIENPPKLDLNSLASLEKESILKVLESVAQIGCFQVINHGVSRDLIESVLAASSGIFRIPPEKRKVVTRSAERVYGFEEGHGEDDDQEMSEEFVWCRDERLVLDMEGIWPLGYSNFREKLEKLSSDVGMVAEKILKFLRHNSSSKTHDQNGAMLEDQPKYVGPLCLLKKHSQSVHGDQGAANSLRHDIIRMLIRGSEFSHALCMHICIGSEEFHVYSKKGWASFQSDKDALIVTIGDQLQAWSAGQYKHVIGRPVFKGVDEDCISMALLYAPADIKTCEATLRENNISLVQQVLIVIFLALVYNFWMYVWQK